MGVRFYIANKQAIAYVVSFT